MTQDVISLNLEPRQVMGKAVKHLRSNGQIPAIIHDHGKASLHVQGDNLTILKVWRQAGKHHPIELKTADKDFTVLIKDIAFDPRKHRLTHVVFNAVDKDQQVEADIPIRPKYAEGNEASAAERAGLIVLTQLESVEVKAVASSLPDCLEYDAEKLVEVGDHASVSDLIVPAGVEILTPPEHAIATVYEPSALAAANDAAGGTAEPGDETAVETEVGEGSTEAAEEGAAGSTEAKPAEGETAAAAKE
jgi:large subunit ribosomal protein L25